MSTHTATLRDGRTVAFVEVADPPQGGMKKVYFSPDKSYVVAFFHDAAAAADPNRLARLEAVLTRFNPTTDPEVGKYWQTLFCWPSGIVAKPTLGIVAPAYPANFFFATGPFAGKEKKSNWFTTPKLRKYLPEAERGTLQTSVLIGIRLARAVRRLHQAGLAHSDLSCNNVLIDPVTGQCVVIDIDSLVVPGMFAPDVLGTRGYIAPEVVKTQHLKLADPQRSHPNARTDLHALAVLLYEYLLLRRPLDGPKIHSSVSTEEDEKLAMGAGGAVHRAPHRRLEPARRPRRHHRRPGAGALRPVLALVRQGLARAERPAGGDRVGAGAGADLGLARAVRQPQVRPQGFRRRPHCQGLPVL